MRAVMSSVSRDELTTRTGTKGICWFVSWSDHDRDPARCDGDGTSWLMILGWRASSATVCDTRR
jgi:hypothetical protein